MDPPLTPELALVYLRELSLDVRTAIVVDGDGRRLAGAVEIETPACALLALPDAAGGLAIRTSGGWVFAERSGVVGVVVTAGPLALAALMRHDVSEVVALLSGGLHGGRALPGVQSPPDLLRTLGDAVQRAAGPGATSAAHDS